MDDVATSPSWRPRAYGGDVSAAVAAYCIVVAVFMVVWWGLALRGGALNRPDRRRGEITLHLTAEIATALLLAVGGAVLARGGTQWLALVGLGMLLYTVIQSPGYFLARHEWPPVVMFALLAVLTTVAITVTATL